MRQTGASPHRGQQVPTTDEIAAANKSLVRRFYKEVLRRLEYDAGARGSVAAVHIPRLARRRRNRSAVVPGLLLGHTVSGTRRTI